VQFLLHSYPLNDLRYERISVGSLWTSIGQIYSLQTLFHIRNVFSSRPPTLILTGRESHLRLIWRLGPGARHGNATICRDKDRVLKPDAKSNTPSQSLCFFTGDIDALYFNVSISPNDIETSSKKNQIERHTGSFVTTSPIFNFSELAPFKYGCSCISNPRP